MEINYLLLFIICFVEQISSQGKPVLLDVHLLVRLQDERVRLDFEPFIQRHSPRMAQQLLSVQSGYDWP